MEYESRGGKDNNLSLEQYLNIIRPYFRDMIDNHKAHSEWRIQLVMKIIFVSSIDANEIRIMHTKCDNIEFMSGTETNDVINKLLKPFLEDTKKETKMRGSSFVFEKFDLLEYHLHKKNLNRGSDSPEWIKNKKATINPKNTKDNKCIQYSITVALNHQEIKKDPQIISKLKPFTDNYNWKDIEYPSHSKDWKRFEQNNNTIALNILFVPYNTKQIRPGYISKYNNKCDNQLNLLMITDNEKWHYLE